MLLLKKYKNNHRMNYLDKINQASEYIKRKSSYTPKIGMILGSGLGSLADQIEDSEKYPYDTIPNFPVSTVEGHAGQLVIGKFGGKEVMAMQGRIHFYEGYTMHELTFPVRVMKALGVEIMVVTNACGSISPKMYPGALMFITDHINLMGTNPLIGENHNSLGPRFPDMSQAYPKNLIEIGKAASKELDIETFEGVYSAVSGPYYLSKAELKMVEGFGADTIGMSTIPEVIVANHSGIKSIGISCITDMAVPDGEHIPLEHDKVVEVANQTRPKFIKLVTRIVEKL